VRLSRRRRRVIEPRARNRLSGSNSTTAGRVFRHSGSASRLGDQNLFEARAEPPRRSKRHPLSPKGPLAIRTNLSRSQTAMRRVIRARRGIGDDTATCRSLIPKRTSGIRRGSSMVRSSLRVVIVELSVHDTRRRDRDMPVFPFSFTIACVGSES